MADLRSFIELGKELGLTGTELRDFAESERKRADEEKKSEDARIADKEREQRAHERELKKMDIEALEKSRVDHKDENATGRLGHNFSRLMLPPFDESCDKLESYIERFERYAGMQSWSGSDKAACLSTLLRGKALDVYSRLSWEEATDYEKIKDALLRAFQLTQEGFRKKFLFCKPEAGESPTQFIFRMDSYFDRWIEAAKIKKDYNSLRRLFLSEHYFSVIPRDMAVYLMDRNLVSMTEIANQSERFMEVRGWSRIDQKPKSDNKNNRKTSNYHDHNSKQQDGEYAKHRDTSRGYGGMKGVTHCYNCQNLGHIARHCPRNKVVSVGLTEESNSAEKVSATCVSDQSSHSCSISDTAAVLECGCNVPMLSTLCNKTLSVTSSLPITNGYVENNAVRVMRDTGCNSVVVKSSLVPKHRLTGGSQRYIMIDRTIRVAPLAKVHIDTPFYLGEVEALCLEDPICELIVGNIPNATMGNLRTTAQPDSVVVNGSHQANQEENPVTVGVTTRSQARMPVKELQPLVVPEAIQTRLGVDHLKELQTNNIGLKRLREQCNNNVTYTTDSGTVRFSMNRGLMYRYYTYKYDEKQVNKQLILPEQLRLDVLRLGHEAVMSGHLGVSKTRNRILSQFYWLGIGADVSRFCQSCDKCQKTIPRGRILKAPVQKMPIIDVPFRRVAIDIVGPIEPRSEKGNRYILTLVDFATRYPEAIALPKITTEVVAEALIQMYSRIGVPDEVLSDNGSQLTSDMMSEVCRLLSIDQLRTTPYHAMCNGLCEKMNGTLKHMLRKVCMDNPKNWDRYIEPILFAYCEVPQDSTGFSPFELVYGRTVRGPMAVLHDLWTKESLNEEVKTTYEYVFNLRNRLEDIGEIARKNLFSSQTRYKKYFDRHSKKRSLAVGSLVLLLLPTKTNKLLMRWRVPFKVIDTVGINDYRVQIGSKIKIYHVNMLKEYVQRAEPSEVNIIAAIDAEEELREFDNEELLQDYPSTKKETDEHVHINPELTSDQHTELKALICEYGKIFSSTPGLTNLLEHDIVVTDDKPLHLKPYPIPHSMMDTVRSEIDEMLANNIIEPAVSPYRFPLLMVKKKDGTARPVTDFRKLNRITIFDAEPMADANAIYAKTTHSRFLSKIDFCKGYWQIPLKDDAKKYTAFYAPFGSFRFTRTAFGLINAGSTYNHMMRILLNGLDNVENFVDDVLSHTATWELHIKVLRQLFTCVRSANLTVKPSKCYFGYSELEYVGHRIGSGNMCTLSDKIKCIEEAKVPENKTALRSYLGLTGYYHKYVPGYAAIAAPLTDMIRKGSPNRLEWLPNQIKAFDTLKEKLCSAPILRLPDAGKFYVVRVDASDHAVGAVLLQEHDSILCPVSYASRKLSNSEVKFSVIEKECLAVVWAVKKCMVYLYGKPFVLQTDHQPLAFLNQAKIENPRIMCWALFLQTMSFTIEVIKGKDNVGADYMSRSEPTCEV